MNIVITLFEPSSISLLFHILITLQPSYSRKFLRHSSPFSFQLYLFRPLMHPSTLPSPPQRAYKSSSSPPSSCTSVLVEREKDGSENEVIRVCLLQIPLVNTDRSAVVGIHSTTITRSIVRIYALVSVVCFHFHGLPAATASRTVQFEMLIKVKSA